MKDSKDDITSFKADMLEFKDDMTNFKTDMLEFKDDMTNFKTDMLEFKDKTEKSLCSLTQSVNEIQKFLIVMEHDMNEKFDALFVAFSATQDQHEFLKNDLNNQDIRLDRHSFRINALESKINLHSEQLAKLNS